MKPATSRTPTGLFHPTTILSAAGAWHLQKEINDHSEDRIQAGRAQFHTVTIGVVYIFANAGLPGARKIGRTIRGADRRAAEVTKAYGTIHPFIVESKHVVTDPNDVEAIAHRLLRKRRVKNTEIFYVSKEEAPWAVKTAARMVTERSPFLRAWHWLVLRPKREPASRSRR